MGNQLITNEEKQAGWNKNIVSEYHRKILHDRAVALSRIQIEEHNEHSDKVNVVSFYLSGEIYCLEADFVKEVLPLKELTVVPCTPAFILGVINIRGEIFTVLNLKKVFNLSERGISEFNKVMIIQYKNISFGIVADSIIGTQHVLRSKINQAPYSTSGNRNEYISGVTTEGLIILNGADLIKSTELIVDHKTK